MTFVHRDKRRRNRTSSVSAPGSISLAEANEIEPLYIHIKKYMASELEVVADFALTEPGLGIIG